MTVQTQDEALKTLFSDRRLTLSTLVEIDETVRLLSSQLESMLKTPS